MIKKFPLMNRGHGTFYVSNRARFLSAAFQGNQLVVWVDDPDTNPPPGSEIRLEVVTRLTGDDGPEGYRHLATAMTDEGRFVVHVFVAGEVIR